MLTPEEAKDRLDDKGRCCGRKPLEYRNPPRKFCPRCDRAYSPTGEQIENFAWRKLPGATAFSRRLS